MSGMDTQLVCESKDKNKTHGSIPIPRPRYGTIFDSHRAYALLISFVFLRSVSYPKMGLP